MTRRDEPWAMRYMSRLDRERLVLPTPTGVVPPEGELPAPELVPVPVASTMGTLRSSDVRL